MTMSVGLGRIVADPQATVLTRKALGVLSEPGLLCYDDALTIDDTGRFVVRVKPNGKILKDEEGLYLEVTFGIDSHVDLDSDEYDRDWNAYVTGTAPNFFEGRVAIGEASFEGVSDAMAAQGLSVEESYVCVTSQRTQLRLRYDSRNFLGIRTIADGTAEMYCIGTEPGFHIVSGNGLREGFSGGLQLNHGSVVSALHAFNVRLDLIGGGTAGAISYEEHYFFFLYPNDWFTFDEATDHISICPLDGVSIPAEWLAYTARIDSLGQLNIRICWIGVTAAESRYWKIVVTRLSNMGSYP